MFGSCGLLIGGHAPTEAFGNCVHKLAATSYIGHVQSTLIHACCACQQLLQLHVYIHYVPCPAKHGKVSHTLIISL